MWPSGAMAFQAGGEARRDPMAGASSGCLRNHLEAKGWSGAGRDRVAGEEVTQVAQGQITWVFAGCCKDFSLLFKSDEKPLEEFVRGVI